MWSSQVRGQTPDWESEGSELSAHLLPAQQLERVLEEVGKDEWWPRTFSQTGRRAQLCLVSSPHNGWKFGRVWYLPLSRGQRPRSWQARRTAGWLWGPPAACLRPRPVSLSSATAVFPAGVDTMASYEEVLHLLRYRNWHTRSLLDRKFKLVCSELNGRYVSNEFQVEVGAGLC